MSANGHQQPAWVQFNLGSYAKNTRHLTTIQHGAYDLLMWAYYATGSLPKDDKALATICKMTMQQWKLHKPTLAAFFDADWRHDRIERELASYRLKAETNARNGGAGGRAKARKSALPDPQPSLNFESGPPPENSTRFEPILLKTQEPPLANATISLDRIKSQDSERKRESSSFVESAARAEAPASPEPVAEPPRVDDDDRALSREKLISRVASALGPKTNPIVAYNGVETVQEWITAGFDFERDILPTLVEVGLDCEKPDKLGRTGLRTLKAGFVLARLQDRIISAPQMNRPAGRDLSPFTHHFNAPRQDHGNGRKKSCFEAALDLIEHVDNGGAIWPPFSRPASSLLTVDSN